MNVKLAREWLSECINTLADPHDAADFVSEGAALRQTISDALEMLQKVTAALGE